MYTKGQIVYSKCGRDKGKAFIIVNFDDEFLYLVDGELRKVQSPKKKKKKHTQIVGKIDLHIKKILDENLYLLDADIKKALKYFKVI